MRMRIKLINPRLLDYLGSLSSRQASFELQRLAVNGLMMESGELNVAGGISTSPIIQTDKNVTKGINEKLIAENEPTIDLGSALLELNDD